MNAVCASISLAINSRGLTKKGFIRARMSSIVASGAAMRVRRGNIVRLRKSVYKLVTVTHCKH